jgi:hypothetical protein
LRLHRWSTREGTRGLRTFATLYDNANRELVDGRVEGYVGAGAAHTMLGLSFSDEPSGVQVSAGVAHLFDVWLTIGSSRLASWVYRRYKLSLPEYDIADLRYHDKAVWWSVWHPKHSWTRGTPRWRHGNFHWVDWLFGKRAYSCETVEGPMRVMVPMPERSYPATATLERATWKRPRWPWPTHVMRVHIDVLKDDGSEGGYIPEPGKGENSWDCGPDGVFSMTCPARSIEEGVGVLVGSALRTRRRRGVPLDYGAEQAVG